MPVSSEGTWKKDQAFEKREKSEKKDIPNKPPGPEVKEPQADRPNQNPQL